MQPSHMSFLVLEIAAVVLTLLAGLEMRRQRMPWRSVLVRSVIVLAVLTTLIGLWRGL
jgi:hypothetical protein